LQSFRVGPNDLAQKHVESALSFVPKSVGW